MKYAVFISSGLGDAVLMVPLVKKLKEDGKITGFFDPTFQCQQLFDDNDLFEKIILLRRNTDYVKTLIKYKNKFDISFLNYFSATRKNLLLAVSLSKETRTNKLPNILPGIKKSNINFIEPKKGIHDAEQNLRLLDLNDQHITLNEKDFTIDYTREKSSEETLDIPNAPYLAIQICSANNIHQYKNWPMNYWIELLKLLSKQYEEFHFVLIGDANESSLASQIVESDIERVHSLVGCTSISELTSIIRNSRLFIGLDGGPMHISVSQGTPTFTIWGASDYNLYGYQDINKENNQIVYKEISCHPCNSWIAPNTSRVMDPQECPDFACIRSLNPETVLSKLIPFANRILNST